MSQASARRANWRWALIWPAGLVYLDDLVPGPKGFVISGFFVGFQRFFLDTASKLMPGGSDRGLFWDPLMITSTPQASCW
jgi:hypothetical protein